MHFGGVFKLSKCAGQSVVELALLLPFLVVLMLGLIDISRAIHAYNIIANMSREGANLALRTTIAPQDIMNSLANTAQPLSMSSKGMMYLTEVQGVTSANSTVVPTIKSRTAWNVRSAPASSVNTNTISRVLGNIQLKNGEVVRIFEVFYQYDSLFKQSGLYAAYSPQLHSMAIF